jgi:hypothetical protein
MEPAIILYSDGTIFIARNSPAVKRLAEAIKALRPALLQKGKAA